MFKRADKMFSKLGYEKCELDSKLHAHYRKKDKATGVIKRIDIYRKSSKDHVAIAYQEDVNGEGFNNAFCMTRLELKAAMAKLREFYIEDFFNIKPSVS